MAKGKKNAMDFLASMESVAIAQDKEVNTGHIGVGNADEDVAPICPAKEVDAEVKNTPTHETKDGSGDGKAIVQDVKNVKANTTTDAGNTGEEDAVTNKTADQVKAGEKDLTLGVISKENNIEGNEAEHIPNIVADDAVMNVEEEIVKLDQETGITAGIDSALEKADEVGEDLERMGAVETALESYIGILKGLRAKNERPSRELAATIQASLKSHNQAYFAHTVPSLEAFGRPDELSRHNATVSLEANLSAKLGELKEVGVSALYKLLDLLVDAWHSVSRDVPDLVAKLGETIKAVQGAELHAGEKVKFGGARRLMIGGEFAGDSVEAVKTVERVANELLVSWPNALIQVVKSVEGGSEKVAEVAQSALESTFASFTDLKSGDAPSELSEFSTVVRSPTLLGNRVMYIGVGGGTNASENVASLNKFMRFEFKSDASADSESDITIPSAERALAALNGVKGLLTSMMGKDTATHSLKELKRNLVTSKGTESGDVVRGAINGALSQHRVFMGYLVSLVKAYIVFYNHISGVGKGSSIEDESATVA
jgi:hypothetical protein